MALNNSTKNGKLERFIFISSLIVLGACGLAIIAINMKTESRQKRYASMLTQQLWKFSPSQTKEEKYLMYLWGWRKLVMAGFMVSAVIVSCTVKKLGINLAIIIGATVILIWICGLIVIWYIMFQPDIDDNCQTSYTKMAKVKTSSSLSKTSESAEQLGWNSRQKVNGGDKRLPITVVTGFLGSGKTTLIKNILHNTVGMKILVVENEIGTEGIDHDLLLQETNKEEIVIMNNGCICCTVRKDLLRTFHSLFSDEAFSKLEWIVIETTGLADPAPLIQSLYMDDKCAERMRLDAVLTVVDSKHLPIHIKSSNNGEKGAHGGVPEAVQQLAFADRILLNKIDLVTDEELQAVVASVVGINPTAQMITCAHSQVPLEEILNIKAFDATRNKALLNAEAATEEPKLIQVDRTGKILSRKTSFGKPLIRPSVTSSSGTSSSSIVDSNDSNDSMVSTLSLTCDEPLQLDALNEWLGGLLREYGTGLYRLKGILSVAGYDRQFVAHGIHMLFDGQLGPLWSEVGVEEKEEVGGVEKLEVAGGGGAKISRATSTPLDAAQRRRSRLVLIGTSLHHDKLRQGFMQCRKLS